MNISQPNTPALMACTAIGSETAAEVNVEPVAGSADRYDTVADTDTAAETNVRLLLRHRGRDRSRVRLHGGHPLLASSALSLLAAVRVLIGESVAVLAMRHAGGCDHVTLDAPVGVAGRFKVEAARNGRPRFARWRVGRDAGISPPVRLFGDPATDIATDLTAIHGDEVTA